jgi:hypothetical protein
VGGRIGRVSGDRSVTVREAASDDDGVWAWWVVGGLVAWLVVGAAVALLLGSMIRLADRREGLREDVLRAEGVAPVAAPRSLRRRVPLSPLGIGLVVTATALMVSGYVVRLSGSTGPYARLLSMDASFSLPRTFVALTFAAAAIAALAGAGRIPGRRTWWTAVGMVAAGIAAVKAGSSVHVVALATLNDAVTPIGGLIVSAALATSVVAALWFLSRTEPRDRRRVLSGLALYGCASVGLSAISSSVAGAYGGGSTLAAAATFLEETGEALAGVLFLMAVLVGVAPRLVLPADWVLRREADAYTLDLPEQAPSAARKGALG